MTFIIGWYILGVHQKTFIMESSILTPAFFVHQSNFQNSLLYDWDGNNHKEKSSNYWEQKLKDSFSYKWGNSHKFLQITMQGHLFTFSVYSDKNNWTINLWDVTGANALGSYSVPIIDKEKDILPNETFFSIIDDCEDFVRGVQSCSGCKTKIKKEEIAGQYFAGRYCEKCWESKYRAMEARETYN